MSYFFYYHYYISIHLFAKKFSQFMSEWMDALSKKNILKFIKLNRLRLFFSIIQAKISYFVEIKGERAQFIEIN